MSDVFVYGATVNNILLLIKSYIYKHVDVKTFCTQNMIGQNISNIGMD